LDGPGEKMLNVIMTMKHGRCPQEEQLNHVQNVIIEN